MPILCRKKNFSQDGELLIRAGGSPRVPVVLVWWLLLLLLLAACSVSLMSPGRAAAHAANSRGGKSLRVMTYNIHVGIGMDRRLDLARIAEVINRERPDLVGLQEVDRGVERTHRVDQIGELARLTRMEYAFAHNLNYQGGQYGVAVLSRFPILALDHRRYANRREAERRGFLSVEIALGERRVNFVTTHLDYQFKDGRLFETEQLLSALEDISAPLIVVGDFNDEPAGDAYKLMLTRFADAWGEGQIKGAGLTYPADRPVKRIDYIFHSKGDGIHIKRARVIHTSASDHLPLIADCEIERQ